jgi:hypothetical protein
MRHIPRRLPRNAPTTGPFNGADASGHALHHTAQLRHQTSKESMLFRLATRHRLPKHTPVKLPEPCSTPLQVPQPCSGTRLFSPFFLTSSYSKTHQPAVLPIRNQPSQTLHRFRTRTGAPSDVANTATPLCRKAATSAPTNPAPASTEKRVWVPIQGVLG